MRRAFQIGLAVFFLPARSTAVSSAIHVVTGRAAVYIAKDRLAGAPPRWRLAASRIHAASAEMGIYDRGYYRDDSTGWQPQRYRSPRSIVVVLIVINVGVWLLDAFTPQVPDSGGLHWLSFFFAHKMNTAGGALPFYQVFPWNLWQLLTSGFVHSPISSPGGIFHIAFNMLMLFFLGRPVEERYGKLEFLRFYLLAIIFAGLVSTVYHFVAPGGPVVELGASGGVMAVAMLFVFNFPQSILLLFGVIPIRAWLLGVILIATDVASSFNPESKIGWQAHLGGAAFGAAYFFFKWNFSFLPLDKLAGAISMQPKLKVHHPDHKQDRLREQADQVLEKLHREGEASLSARERRILEQYSRSVRENRGDL